MPTYAAPGVHIEEIPTLPPSVAGVSSAIPAFIGSASAHPGTPAEGAPPVRVRQVETLLEFEQAFGRTTPTTIATDDEGNVTSVAATPQHFLWYAIKHYFDNGGGRCYVLAVNNQQQPLTQADFERGLARLAEIDEPTLVVMPELIQLEQQSFDAVCQAALLQCATLKDRFAILDVRQNGDRAADDDIAAARNGYGAANLDYGAAYYPYLQTALTHAYVESQVTVGTADPAPTLDALRWTNSALYNRVRRNLAQERVILPPSAAVAGIYARVDRQRGVWKAPANEGVLQTLAPTVDISQERQARLNVDATSGKSINAIRSFAGRGILVWGARTLAGNDNEWRYVNVRRLFIMIEESTKAASAFAVFEPNDANTWLKVRGMIESFLYGLWEQGALQGSTPAQAYFVNVGLGTTMNPDDVLEGRMIVEIGIAAVRPAEFIILRFSHLTAQT